MVKQTIDVAAESRFDLGTLNLGSETECLILVQQ